MKEQQASCLMGVTGCIHDHLALASDVAANIIAQAKDAFASIMNGSCLDRVKLTYSEKPKQFNCMLPLLADKPQTGPPKGELRLESLPPSPAELVHELGMDKIDKIKKTVVYKCNNARWNPLLYETKLIWFSGTPEDSEIPELK